jgi:hypothetical protein
MLGGFHKSELLLPSSAVGTTSPEFLVTKDCFGEKAAAPVANRHNAHAWNFMVMILRNVIQNKHLELSHEEGGLDIHHQKRKKAAMPLALIRFIGHELVT